MLSGYQINQVMPCKADVNKIRVICDLEQDISKVLPYLNAVIHLGTYTGMDNPSMTFKYQGRLITLYPQKATLAKIADLEDAKFVMSYLLELINDTYTRRNEIVPIYQQRPHPNPMEIYKKLPRTNCKLCGEPACMAFAVKLIQQEQDLACCPQLKEEKYQGQRLELEAFLSSFGS